MVGHPSEALFWAPDPRDDLAFTMYAIKEEEIRDTKDQIVVGLVSGKYAPGATFYGFKEAMIGLFPIAENFTDKDWDDIYAVW